MPSRKGRNNSNSSRATSKANNNVGNDLFFVDKEGDASLFHTATVADVVVVGEDVAEPVTVPQDSFISLYVKKERAFKPKNGGRGVGGRGRGSGRGWGRGKSGQLSRNNAESSDNEEEIDPEEMALAMDYIQNASVGDLSVISTTSLSARDIWLEGDSEDESAEVGMYEALMLGVDDELLDSSEDDSAEDLNDDDDDDYIDSDESDRIAAFKGLALDSEDDERAEERYLKADFEGGPSAWDGGRGSDLERKIHRTLQGDFSTPKRPSSSNHFARSPIDDRIPLPLSRTQRRKADKRDRAVQKKQIQDQKLARDSSARALHATLGRAHGPKINNEIAGFLVGVNRVMRTFVQNIRSDQSDSVALTPMPSAIRNLVAAMAKHYHVIPKTRGKGKHKITVLIRTQRSTVPRDWSRLVEKVVAEADGKLSGNTRSPQSFNKSYKERKAGKLPGPPNEDAKPKLGSIVGHGSAAIAETNVGHRMLKAMGWAPGQALGADGSGLINPVEVTIRGKRAGLGT